MSEKVLIEEVVEVSPARSECEPVSDRAPTNGRPEIDELFGGGPLTTWQRRFGLSREKPRLALRCLIAVAIGWAPLVLINAYQMFVMGDEAAKTFFSDVAVHGRFLIAVPLLILAESDCIPRFTQVIRNFLTAGLIRDGDKKRYSAAVASCQRLANSSAAKIILVAIAYGIAAAMIYYVPTDQVPVWHRSSDGTLYFSLDGWWHALVSIPLLLVLFLVWIWRIFLWARLLTQISRLDLRLVPSHPDRVGGLRFISTSLRGFRLLGLAFGTIAAGVVADKVLLNHTSPFAFKYVPVFIVLFVISISAGPLCVFVSNLRQAHGQAMFTYGTLAGDMGEQFKRKWVDQPVDLKLGFEVRDFSATSALFRTIENAYGMHEMPIGRNDLIELVFATLLPFLPVALMAVPVDQLLPKLLKFLL
jgi:hypothetical protein